MAGRNGVPLEDLAQKRRVDNNAEKRARLHEMVDELCDRAALEHFTGMITLEMNSKNGYFGTPAMGSKSYG